MSKPTKRTGHRNYVQMWTAYVSDVDFIILGQAARHSAPLLVMYSGQQGHNGLIPSDPRRVQAFLLMDGGAPAAEAVLTSLLGARFLEPTDDPEWLHIRSWDKYQADMGGSESRAASNAVASLRQHHRIGNGRHPQGDVEGCPDCAAGMPSPLSSDATPVASGQDANRSATEPLTAALPVEPASVDALSADYVRSIVRERLGDAVAVDRRDGASTLDTYLDFYASMGAAAAKYVQVKGITETVLLNEVIAHAAVSLWTRNGKAPTHRTLGALTGWRRDYGGEAVLAAIHQAADPSVKSPFGYAKTILAAQAVVE